MWHGPVSSNPETLMRTLAIAFVVALVILSSRPDSASVPVGVLTHLMTRDSASWGRRQLRTTIWYPAQTENANAGDPITNAAPSNRGPFPIVVYSHGGCGGSPQAIAPIAIPLAGAGFAVVQFPHPGSTADDCVSDGPRYTQALLERPDDILSVIDSLKTLDADSSWPLRGVLDTGRVGILGHSQGGQTALMMPSRDTRVAAVLSISPSVAHPDAPPAIWEAIASVHVPVMIIRGARDAMWTSAGPLRAFDSLPADTPRAYLEVAAMGHTPSSPDEVAFIVRYASGLFRYYLQHDRTARGALEPSAAPAGVSMKSVRFP
jgi:predicted dienelactone hydrolase